MPARNLYCIDPDEALTTGTYGGDERRVKTFLELADSVSDLYDPLPDGIVADPLLLDVPTVFSDDSYFRNSADVQVRLNNIEGNFTETDMVGRFAQIWGLSAGEKRLVLSGQVFSQEASKTETTLVIRDLPIASLDTLLPRRVITEEDFPFSQSQGAEIPIVFGRVLRHRCPNLATGYQTALTGAVDNDLVTPVTYGMVENVPGLSFTPSNRKLSGAPTIAGFYDAIYRMTDNEGKVFEKQFPVEVRDGGGFLYVADALNDRLWKTDPDDPDVFIDGTVSKGEFFLALSQPRGMAGHNGFLYAVQVGQSIVPFRPGTLYRINPNDPDDETGGYGLVGNLPAELRNPRAMTSHGGHLYISNATDSGLWRINPDNPSDTTGVYGKVGRTPVIPGRGTIESLVSHKGSLYAGENRVLGAKFWRINPNDPDDQTGIYGLVGNLPSLIGRPDGMASDGTNIYVASATNPDTVYRINPSNPSDETGIYGVVGYLPSGLEVPFSMTYFGGEFYIADDTGDELWEIHLSDLPRPLPSGITNPLGMTSHEGSLYILNRSGTTSTLWRINPKNPRDETGVYGEIGDMPSGIYYSGSLVFLDRRLHVLSNTGLWRINPDNPSDTTGVYGKVGDLPSGLSRPYGADGRDGVIYVVGETSDKLWRINLDNPSDTSGIYGEVGDLPSGLTTPNALAFHLGNLYVTDSGERIWLINTNDPDDISGDYGLIGDLPPGLENPFAIVSGTPRFPTNFTTADDIKQLVLIINDAIDVTFPVVDADRKFNTLKIKLDSLLGIAKGDVLSVGVGTDNAETARVSVVNATDNNGNPLPPTHADYHTVEFLDGLRNDHAAGVVVANNNHIFDYLLGEGVAGNDNFESVSRVYHGGRALPEIEHSFSAAAPLTGNAKSRISLPDRLRVNIEDWYVNFTAAFVSGSSIEIELLIEKYDHINNTITVTNPGSAAIYDKIVLAEYQFFNGSQNHPHKGLAFVRIAKPYTQEITADVRGFPITNPVEVVETLLVNDVWGAGETETFTSEGAALSNFKFEGVISRSSVRNIIQEIALFREFKLFREKDGIHFRTYQAEGSPSLLPDVLGEFAGAPTLSRASLDSRASSIKLLYRRDGQSGEATQSLTETAGLGNHGPEREIIGEYIYEAETADRVLVHQKERELSRRRTLECAVEVPDVNLAALKVGKVLRLPAGILENTASDWLLTSIREDVEKVAALRFVEYSADLYSYPGGRTIPPALDTYKPETDFSETPPEPIRDLEITAVVCQTVTDDKTIEENCIALNYEIPDENYIDAEIEYHTSTGAIQTVGRGKKSFEFAVPFQAVLYSVFVYSRSPNNDLRGHPIIGLANFETGDVLALPPGLTVEGGQISSVPFVRVTITSEYTPPGDFSQVLITVNFKVGGLIYQSKTSTVLSGDISTLWVNDGLTISTDFENIPTGDLTAAVTVQIHSTEKGGTSKQLVVNT